MLSRLSCETYCGAEREMVELFIIVVSDGVMRRWNVAYYSLINTRSLAGIPWAYQHKHEIIR